MGMSDMRGELLQQIKDKAVVHGKVILSSGMEADWYIDLRRITLDGVAAPSSVRSCSTSPPSWTSTASAV